MTYTMSEDQIKNVLIRVLEEQEKKHPYPKPDKKKDLISLGIMTSFFFIMVWVAHTVWENSLSLATIQQEMKNTNTKMVSIQQTHSTMQNAVNSLLTDMNTERMSSEFAHSRIHDRITSYHPKP